MGKLKGFYFSLDAILAASVLLATIGFLVDYEAKAVPSTDPSELDYIHTASMQEVSDWNESINSSQIVIEYIYSNYYSGNISRAVAVCEGYFYTESKYAVYMANSTDRSKMCGSSNLEGDVSSHQTVSMDLPVNGTFQGPKIAIMVIED